jgi:F-type H+-transporting ATPase subunit epsilon
MAHFHFDLVSPQRVLFSGDVEQVDIPGSEGDFGVLAGHAPLIAMLRPGIVSVLGAPGGPTRVVIADGYAEVNPEGLTILAELATPLEEFDRAGLDVQIKDTEEDVADTPEGRRRDQLSRRLEQLRQLQAALAT